MAVAPPVYLFGAGPYGRLLRRMVEDVGRAVAGFVVDETYRCAETFDGLPLDASEDVDWGADAEWLIAVGYRSMRARAQAADRIVATGGRLATIVGEGAHVAGSARIGAGSIVFPGTVVEHFAELGINTVLWSGAIVCHDTVIGAHNYLAPGVTLSGNCAVGSRCFFGTRASAIDGIRVGDDCQVDAGAVLTSDAIPQGRYRGIPARRIGMIDPAEGVRISR